MLKLSISLPNNAQIDLESEDAAVIDKILGIVLVDVTRALLELPLGSGAGLQMEGTTQAQSVATSNPSRPSVLQIPAETGPEAVASDGEPPAREMPARPTVDQGGQVNPSQPITQHGQTDMGPDPAHEESTAVAAPPIHPKVGEWAPFEGFQVDVQKNSPEGVNGLPNPGGRYNSPSSLTPAVSEQAFIEFCRAANPLGDMRRVVVAAEGASRYLAMEGVDAEALGNLFDVVGWPRAHSFVQTLRNAARSKFGWLERIPGRAGHYSVTDMGRATALGR